jgi:hypothetical protein
MAWLRHGRYWYRSRRIGDRVISEYLGAGPVAQMAAERDQAARDRRAKARAAEMAAQKADLAIDKQLDQLGDLVRAMTTAALVAGGYHTHKGQWRQMRVTDDKST